MAVNPNSLANLRPPWQPGEQGTAGVRYVERTITRAQKAAPQAMRLLERAMRNPELPMSLRCRIAEYIVDKAWPKEAQNGLLGALSGGAEFLELRFVSPTAETLSAKHQEITMTYEVEEVETHNPTHNDAEPGSEEDQ